MSASFLFVPYTPTTGQKQKELKYAEVKSHTSRNAHQKRRRKIGLDDDGNTVTQLRPTFLCGRADPFDSQLVPATAVTDQLVSFCQLYHNRCWSPSFAPGIATSSTAWRLIPCDHERSVLPAAKSLWDLFVMDQGTFWAAVSSAVHEFKHLVSNGQGHEFQKVSLQMKGKGLNSLRQALAREEHIQPTINMIYHVKALFRESCGSGELDAARAHAKSLNWLINNLPTSEMVPPPLRVVLWSDAVYALRQLRRPVIDYLDWLPHLRRDIWESAVPLLIGMEPSIADEPPGCILTSPLREAFLHVRYALHISKYLMLDSDRWESNQEKESMFLWITTKAEYHVCSLLNLYFDLLEPTSNIPCMLTPSQRITEAALTLALLYTLQKSFCAVPLDNGIDLHESARTFHQPLKHLVQRSRQHWAAPECISYRQAFLWVLFVGASCEERLRLDRSYGVGATESASPVGVEGASDMEWFHRELAKEADLADLKDWTDARAVLSRFALNERLDPNALVWYEVTVRDTRPIASGLGG